MPLKTLYAGIDLKVQQAVAEKHDVKGLCCSFAMDWLKKRLAGKEVNANTYLDRRRLSKIAKRQKEQEKDAGIAAVAEAYGLTVRSNFACQAYLDHFDDWEIDNKEISGEAYYVSCSSSDFNGEGHGFAVDARTAPILLADVGSGICRASDGMSVVDVCKEHFVALKEVLTHLLAFLAYPVTLEK